MSNIIELPNPDKKRLIKIIETLDAALAQGKLSEEDMANIGDALAKLREISDRHDAVKREGAA